jgi:ferric-dicitrate binding protein FerR (iron transport regulator)
MKKNISLIIARSLLKISQKDEKEALSNWKNISEENTSFAEGLETYWNLPFKEEEYTKLQLARKRLLSRLMTNTVQRPKKSLTLFFSRIAAVLILIISVAGLSVYIAYETGVFYKSNSVQVSTEPGQQSTVTLPDGSSVWLNAKTDVKYYVDNNVRRVSLSGEAYFEVKHVSNQPFIVEAGNAKIKVIGTSFNVSHYPDSKIIETSLITGKITMTFPGSSGDINVQPGQRITYNTEKLVFSRKNVDVQKEILWRQGVLIFENELFGDLLHKLEQYYAVKFIYENGVFEDIHYTGTIDNLSINKVLDFINLTIPIKYEIDNKTINLCTR